MLVMIMALWASGVVVSRGVHELVPPIGFSFWRWCAATILMAPFIAPEIFRARNYVRRRFGYFMLLGMFVAGASTLVMGAAQHTTATNILLVSAAQPSVTVIVAWFVLKDRLAPMQLVGILAAAFGIVIMIARMDFNVVAQLSFNVGDILVVASVFFFAFYTVHLHQWIEGMNPFPIMFMTCLTGTLVLLPAYLAESLFVETVPLDIRVVSAILFMAVVPTIVATTMWNASVKKVGANRASVFINLLPVFGTCLAVVFLDEQLRDYHLIGATFVCIGITLVLRVLPFQGVAASK